MEFDEQTLAEGSSFAGELSENFKKVSAGDLQLAMLAVLGGVELRVPRLESVRRQICPPKISANRVLFAIAALCELGRLRGERQIPPTRVIDIMSHMQAFREELPENAVIQCHGESMLPLAIWFSSLGASVHFTGSQTLAECASAVAGNAIYCEQQEAAFVPDAYHYALLHRSSLSLPSFCRGVARSGYRGAVVLTTWSFLNSTSPAEVRFKKNFIDSGALHTVIQLPAGLMPRGLPALIQLEPHPGKAERIRLIDARDWYVLSNDIIEVGYLRPILYLVDREKNWKVGPDSLVPPMEDVSREELERRQYDLRPRRLLQSSCSESFRRLDECAVIIRGQMMPARMPGQSPHRYKEVVLTDIDGFGLIGTASRLLDNAPQLSRQRELALLRKKDILISSKGSLLSLGTVGIVAEPPQKWLPNQTFCLVRATTVDPIWLFHFMRSKAAQEYFKAHTSGTTVPQIKARDLYSLAVPMPSEKQLDAVHRLHDGMLKLVNKVRKLKESHAHMMEQCESVFSACL